MHKTPVPAFAVNADLPRHCDKYCCNFERAESFRRSAITGQVAGDTRGKLENEVLQAERTSSPLPISFYTFPTRISPNIHFALVVPWWKLGRALWISDQTLFQRATEARRNRSSEWDYARVLWIRRNVHVTRSCLASRLSPKRAESLYFRNYQRPSFPSFPRAWNVFNERRNTRQCWRHSKRVGSLDEKNFCSSEISIPLAGRGFPSNLRSSAFFYLCAITWSCLSLPDAACIPKWDLEIVRKKNRWKYSMKILSDTLRQYLDFNFSREIKHGSCLWWRMKLRFHDWRITPTTKTY